MRLGFSRIAGYFLFVFVLMVALGAMAADQTYDDTSGDNVWDTSTANWDAGVAWTNGNSAIFGGTGESVTVDTVTANGITFNASGYTLAGGTITSGGTITASESATINSAISLNTGQSWSAANGKTLTLGGVVSGGNSLTYGGSGTYVVDGSNTMSENVVIDGATVRVNTGKTLLLSGGGWVKKTVTVQNNGVLEAYEYANGAALWGQTGDDANTLTLNDGGTFRFLGSEMNSAVNKGISVSSGTGYFNVENGNSVTWDGNYSSRDFNANSGTELVFDLDGDFTTQRSIRGAGDVTKQGAGTLTINGTSGRLDFNPNGGTFSMEEGGLVVGAVGDWYDMSMGQSAQSTYSQTGGTATFKARELDLGNYYATTANISGGTFTQTKADGDSTDPKVVMAVRADTTLNVSGSANVVLNDVVFGHASGTASTGTINLDGGTLTARQFSKANGTGNFNFDGGTLKAAASNSSYMTGLSAATVQFGGAVIDSNGHDIEIAQALLDGGEGGGLTKQGTGTLTLSGSNTYDGDTDVNAGTLEVDGSLASDVTVASGATLSGSGSLKAVTMNSGSTLSPGNSPGIMTVDGDLTLDDADLAVDIWGLGGAGDASGHDQISFSSGSLILQNSPTITVDLNGSFNPDLGEKFTIVSGIDGWTGTWGDLSVVNGDDFINAGKEFSITQGSLVLEVIPEPATLSLLGLFGLVYILRRKMKI